MNEVLILISVSTQRAPDSKCWFRTLTNEFRLSLVHPLQYLISKSCNSIELSNFQVRASAHDVFKTFLDGGVRPEASNGSGNGINGGIGAAGAGKEKPEKPGGSDTKYLSQIKLKLDNVDAKIK